MTERDADRTPDELYVPTPEELERGIEPGAAERKRASREEARMRGRLSDLARRLFRLRPGVGQQRSEAPAPAPPSAAPDRPPPLDETKPQPASRTEEDTPPMPASSPAERQELRETREPPIRKQRTPPPRPIEPAETPPSSVTTTSKQGLRRVVVPERPRKPVERPAPSPVPKRVFEGVLEKGHRLAPFREQRSALASEHTRRYVSECYDCQRKAYAIKAADPGWTIANTPWETQGSAFEQHCPGNSKRQEDRG